MSESHISYVIFDYLFTLVIRIFFFVPLIRNVDATSALLLCKSLRANSKTCVIFILNSIISVVTVLLPFSHPSFNFCNHFQFQYNNQNNSSTCSVLKKFSSFTLHFHFSSTIADCFTFFFFFLFFFCLLQVSYLKAAYVANRSFLIYLALPRMSHRTIICFVYITVGIFLESQVCSNFECMYTLFRKRSIQLYPIHISTTVLPFISFLDVFQY